MRYELGPTFSAQLSVSVVATVPTDTVATVELVVTKSDVVVILVGVDEVNRTVTLNIPVYDLENHHKLMEIRVYLVLAGFPLPPNGPAYAASNFAHTVDDVSTVQDGGDDVIALPTVAAGKYFGQVVLGFEE